MEEMRKKKLLSENGKGKHHFREVGKEGIAALICTFKI
jgi:hypothetical protein